MKFFKSRKIIIIICIILAAVISIAILAHKNSLQAITADAQQRTSAAFKGTLDVTLSGSGTVSPFNRKEIVSAVDGVVTENYLEEGKSFKKGDLLIKFNDSDVQLSVKQRENALNQKRMSAVDSNISNGALHITAPFTGRIAEVSISEGDEVKENQVLMTIVEDSVLKAQVVFENTAASQFNGIHTVQVHLPDFMTSLSGKIQSVSQVSGDAHVIVTVDNPGSLTSGNSVWAEAKTASGAITSNEGILEFTKKETITAAVSGKVSNLTALKDMKVTQGTILLNIAGDDLPYKVESKQLEIEQAEVELKLAQEKLDFYTIKAPFDSTAVSVSNLDPGDSIESGTSLAIMMDTSKMTFDLDIDELDISSVETGQKVNVTCDALEDMEIIGEVTAIAPEGTTSNGVTSYKVTVTIPGIENLKSGMNVDAVIQVYNKENALLVPVEALEKRGDKYMIWVKRENQQTAGRENNPVVPEKRPSSSAGNQSPAKRQRQPAADSYYSGAVPVEVAIGMYNESYVEITSGLNEGDMVVLPALQASSTNKNTNTQPQGGGGIGGFGGMGGGMPAGGGMPGGVMTGGGQTGNRRQ